MSPHPYRLRARRPTTYTDAEADPSMEIDSDSDADYDPNQPESESDDASDTDASEPSDDASDTDASEPSDDASDSDASDTEYDYQTPYGTLGRYYRVGASAAPPSKRMKVPAKANTSPEFQKWSESLSPDEKHYLKGLSPAEKQQLLTHYQSLSTAAPPIPLRFRLLALPDTALSPASKRLVLQRLDAYQSMTSDHGEYPKYTTWVSALSQLPLGVYHRLPQDQSIPELLNSVQTRLNDAVFGHTETKRQLLMRVAQWLSNPSAKGQCIGIQGPMGIGKTTLIKDGVSQALGFPFGFIALGGATDATFLEGHSFTYEGAVYGRIAELLMKTQVMNPILFFDELDKVSESPKGDEIISLLTHLTDPVQNTVFTDKYFGSVELDLSRCLMVFSFNDSSKINPILKDRLTMVHLSGYTTAEKIQIAERHLLPRLNQQYNFASGEVLWSESVLRAVLSQIPEEKGLRQFIQALERIYGWLNMGRYIVCPPFTEVLTFPFVIDASHLPIFLKSPRDDGRELPPFSMYL